MSVAPSSYTNIKEKSLLDLGRLGLGLGLSHSPSQSGSGTPLPKEPTEALMILGVDREVDGKVVKQLQGDGGVLSVSSVTL